MNRFLVADLVLCVFLVAVPCVSHAQTRAGLETAPALPGSELVAPVLLKGLLHKVVEPVTVQAYLGRFVIESNFGKFSVHGANMLAVRVSELQAIEELQKVQKNQAFKDALSQSTGKVVDTVKGAVTDPVKTVESIGKGVGTVFGRIGYLASSGAAYVGDKVDDATSGAKENPKVKSAPSDEPEPPSFTGDPFGYNMARREWAKKLNIDPYTTNPILRPLLDDASTATFAGNFGVSLTVGALAAPLGYASQLDDTTRQSVWNHPAIDLEKGNEAKLLALGVPGRTVRDLLRNKWFTPSLQTALVARIEVLGRLKGIESIVATAATTQGETRARFLLESLSILAAHYQKEGALAQIRMNNLIPVGIAANGQIVVAVAIDYGIWDKDVVAFAQNREFNTPRKTLLLGGKLSPLAKESLEKAGWVVKTGLRA